MKFDFLGLKTLTVIRNALDLLKARGVAVDIGAIPLDDAKTYEVYASAQTVAVFQVESTGMRTALRQLKPTCIEDIIALVALYRPGPMENIPKFCNVKNGREKRESLHPSIDPILDETQGHHRLPGAGDGDRPQARGLLARRRRPAAPRHGQEDPGRDGRAEAALHRGRQGQRRLQGQGRRGLEPARQVRQLRLQQVARRRLRRGQLPDRLAQGQPPGRVHGRGDELRHPPHRQARPLQAGGRPPRHRGGPAVRQPLRRHLRRRGRPHRLRPRRAQERRRRRHAPDRRGAREGRPLRRPLRLRRPGRPPPPRQAGAGDARPRRRARRPRFQPPQGLREPRGAHGLVGRRARRPCLGAGQPLRRGDRRAPAAAPAAARRLVAHGAAGPGACRHRLLPLRPPARRLCRRAAPRARPHPRRAPAQGRRHPRHHRPGRRHRRRPRPAQVGPRHPLRLRAPLRPHRALRGAHVLRRPRRRPRPPRARHERGADRGGDAGRRRAQAPRQGGAAHRRGGRRRRHRSACGSSSTTPPPRPRSPPASPPSSATRTPAAAARSTSS